MRPCNKLRLFCAAATLLRCRPKLSTGSLQTLTFTHADQLTDYGVDYSGPGEQNWVWDHTYFHPNRPGDYLVKEIDGVWVERVPTFEAVAVRGDGVFDTLKAVSKLVLKSLG